ASDWCWQTKQTDDAVQAAERMAALAPLEAVPLGYLGDLKLKLGDQKGAKAAFQRAFSLDPNYDYAGLQLFHQQLTDQELDEAAQTLALLERKGKTAQTLSCAVQLSVAHANLGEALKAFEVLCGGENADRENLNDAAAALDHAGERVAVDALLDKCLAAPNAPPALVESWVERQLGRNRWNLHRRLQRFGDELNRVGVLCYLDHLGERFNTVRAKKDVTGELRFRFHLWRLLKR